MTLIQCFYGCATEDVLAARGFTLNDLRTKAGAEIARAYDARETPSGWRAKCPCHPDRRHKSRAALSISER